MGFFPDKISGDIVKVAYPVQQEGGGSIPTSPLQLEICQIDTYLAIELNKIWHSRLPKYESPKEVVKISFGAKFDGYWWACAIWTKPIARLLNDKNWLELRRMAIAPKAPKNTASRMISIMVKEIKKTFIDISNLISYQDTEVHTGTIYKASGWISTNISQGSNWQCGRRANPYQAAGPKIRWEKRLRPELEKKEVKGFFY